MKHPSNRELHDYWNERRGSRLAPERADIEPSAIRQVLGDTFVLATDAMGHYPFRLAGTRLCALFSRELKNESFVKLWERSGQTAMRELLAVVMEEKTGVVASVTASTADDSILAVNLECCCCCRCPMRAVPKRGCSARWRRWPRRIGWAPRQSARSSSACSATSARRSKRRRSRVLPPQPAGSGVAWWYTRVAGGTKDPHSS